jgi:signal transduction histidine kinase
MAIADETEERKIDKLLSIEEAGKKIGEQISDILDYSEIDRNDLANNCEDYMLSSLLNDVVNELTPYRKKELELVIDVDASIPSVMNSDAAKIKKILWHTIVNGLKYTNEGGVYVHLSPACVNTVCNDHGTGSQEEPQVFGVICI